MTSPSPDFLLQSYHFDLPETQIAQHPAPERSDSRLMVVNRADDSVQTTGFADILSFLPEGCLLVVNNSRVIPARMWGKRPGGGTAEMLLLSPVPLLDVKPYAGLAPSSPVAGEDSFTPTEDENAANWYEAEAEALLRPAKKIQIGMRLRFTDKLFAELIEHESFGRCKIRLIWEGSLQQQMEQYGTLPLPPYIRRPKGEEALSGPERKSDILSYQTVYAREDKAGSVAAPTAGLHFTPELKKALVDSGRKWAEVTLYVGYGTFSPVRTDDIRDHEMHAEYVEITAETAQEILLAKKEGRAVVAVGTTSCRVLEGVYRALHGHARHSDSDGKKEAAAVNPFAVNTFGETLPQQKSAMAAGEGIAHLEGIAHSEGIPLLAGYSGWINIFLYPGERFYVVDGLITNFHLPESSLVMLVSAFAGREKILAAYQRAISEGFRFFSYGDSMLIL